MGREFQLVDKIGWYDNDNELILYKILNWIRLMDIPHIDNYAAIKFKLDWIVRMTDTRIDLYYEIDTIS